MRMRELLRDAGRAAGFTVVEPFRPNILGVTYEWIRDQRKHALTHTTNPTTGISKPMTRAGDYLTNCEIDLAWLMPLPLALYEFLAEVVGLDPCLREHGLCFPEIWNCCAVVAFEIDTSTGKHAGGGLLNLAAFGSVGIVVTPDSASCAELTKTLMTYQPTLGLRNVFVRTLRGDEVAGA
jgi:hypothetical protein